MARILDMLGAAVLAAALAFPAAAGERAITLDHEGVALGGDLVEPDGATIADGVALIVHGTFAHKDMELIDTLQAALAERGLASLAVTLSLGIDRREGMFACDRRLDDTYEAALDEIGAWRDWLTAEGAGPVVLVGHSRGGAQSARFLSTRDATGIAGAVLLAPALDRGDRTGAYRARFGGDLAALLAEASAMAPDAVMTVPGFGLCETLDVTARSFLSYYAEDRLRDTGAILAGGLPVPTLIVVAGADAVVPDLPAALEEAGIGESGDIRAVTVGGADHMFLDFFAEDAADAIAEFTAELSP